MVRLTEGLVRGLWCLVSLTCRGNGEVGVRDYHKELQSVNKDPVHIV